MNLRKVAQVASRDFLATVTTRAFIIGLLLLPSITLIGVAFVPRLMLSQRGRPLTGEVQVIDETERLGDAVARALSPEAIAARRAEAARQAQAELPSRMRGFFAQNAGQVLGDIPSLTVASRTGPFVADRDRQWLLDTEAVPKRLAIVVIPRDALERSARDGAFGGYALYVPASTDSRLASTVHDAVRELLVGERARTQSIDARIAEAMLRVNRPTAVTVSAGGQRSTDVGFARAMPFVFLMLMFIGVMVGGQGLLMSTIEEKSSRVVEVMLSAVSPLELMVGKLIGQVAVSFLAMSIYVGLGLMALASLAMLGAVDPMMIAYLFAFFFVAYLFNGAAMLAVGAAVNDMREAQSLMTPVTVVLMMPWLIATPILQNPSSTFAIVLSFLPPVNTFAMMLRLGSTAPPPAWQAWLSVAVGLVAAAAVTWGAAKVYRIGLLMYGKPPNLATLLRWVKAA